MFYMLAPFTLMLRLFRHSREPVPLPKLLCTETRLFEGVMLLMNVWMIVQLRPKTIEEKLKFEWTALTAKNLIEFIGGYHVVQPYFIGLQMAMIMLRFFFSLKITRAFGPFIKIIGLSFFNILVWSLFTLICIVIMANFLSILLSQN